MKSDLAHLFVASVLDDQSVNLGPRLLNLS
jgi:hypothetical protein